jgi:hypothetical protein
MREGMVRRRGLMSGGERLLVDLPETAGRTLAASPRTRCSGKANLMNELLAAARTTKTPRRAWTSGFRGRHNPARGRAAPRGHLSQRACGRSFVVCEHAFR